MLGANTVSILTESTRIENFSIMKENIEQSKNEIQDLLLNLEEDVLLDVVFEGGCEGSLIALKHFVEGKHIDEIIDELEYIPCGNRNTSCPDQLAKALKIYRDCVLNKEE